MRLHFLIVGVLFLTSLACTKKGGVWQHYRISALDEAIDRNMSIALHFYDSSCADQKKALEKVIENEVFKPVGAYRVQMGSEKALEKELHIQSPCTLVVFKGAEERGRSKENDPERLRLILGQSL